MITLHVVSTTLCETEKGAASAQNVLFHACELLLPLPVVLLYLFILLSAHVAFALALIHAFLALSTHTRSLSFQILHKTSPFISQIIETNFVVLFVVFIFKRSRPAPHILCHFLFLIFVRSTLAISTNVVPMFSFLASRSGQINGL